MLRSFFFASWFLATLLATLRASAQDNAAVAQQHYSRGVQLFEAAQYAEALAAFRAAHALSGSPNAQLFIARTLTQTGDVAGAASAYERAIHEAEDRGTADVRYVDTVRASRDELQQLEPRIGRLTVRVIDTPSDLRVRIGDRDVPSEWIGVPLPFAPGMVHLEVTASGYVTEARDVEVHSGERGEVAITLRRSPAVVASRPIVRPVRMNRTPSPLFVASLSSAGVAVLGLGAFVGLAVVTGGHYDSLRLRCGDAPCSSEAASDIALGRTLQVWTDVALGIGVAAAVTGTVLFIVDRRRATSVRLGVTPSALIVTGVF